MASTAMAKPTLQTQGTTTRSVFGPHPLRRRRRSPIASHASHHRRDDLDQGLDDGDPAAAVGRPVRRAGGWYWWGRVGQEGKGEGKGSVHSPTTVGR